MIGLNTHKKPKKQLAFALVWTGIYSLLFNTYNSTVSELSGIDVVIGAGWVFFFFLITTYSRIFFFISIPTVFFTSGVVAYGERLIHAPINRNIVASSLQSNWQEIVGITGAFFWAWICLAFILTILCSLHIYYLKLHHHWQHKFIITAGFIYTFWFCADLAYRPFDVPKINIHWQHPYDYFEYAINFLKQSYAIPSMESKQDISTMSATRNKSSGEPSLQVVFVLGETARADHFGIYGYHRNTTPFLEKEKNVFIFRDVKSCGTITLVSVPCLMTRATENNLQPSETETSFISIFKKLKFKTIWVSEQTKYDKFNSIVSSISDEAETTIFQDNNLTLNINEYKKYFINDLLNGAHDKLSIFHMIGSHYPYQWMYPASFAKYVPTCSNKHTELELYPEACPPQALINSYDNTIVFTDHFLANVINSLRDKLAIMVYISDHGEYLGENGKYLHGSETEDKELRHVPMIWWVSDQFIKWYPEKVLAMRSKLHDKLNQDYIFHSILDCAGIDSPIVDKRLSLCSPIRPLKLQKAQ